MVLGQKHGTNYLPYTNVQKADAVVTSLATYAPACLYCLCSFLQSQQVLTV